MYFAACAKTFTPAEQNAYTLSRCVCVRQNGWTLRVILICAAAFVYSHIYMGSFTSPTNMFRKSLSKAFVGKHYTTDCNMVGSNIKPCRYIWYFKNTPLNMYVYWIKLDDFLKIKWTFLFLLAIGVVSEPYFTINQPVTTHGCAK